MSPIHPANEMKTYYHSFPTKSVLVDQYIEMGFKEISKFIRVLRVSVITPNQYPFIQLLYHYSSSWHNQE